MRRWISAVSGSLVILTCLAGGGALEAASFPDASPAISIRSNSAASKSLKEIRTLASTGKHKEGDARWLCQRRDHHVATKSDPVGVRRTYFVVAARAPEVWPEGEVRGLHARGGAVINLKWTPDRVVAEIEATRAGSF